MRIARVMAPLSYRRGGGGGGLRVESETPPGGGGSRVKRANPRRGPSSGPSGHLLPEGEGIAAFCGRRSLIDDGVERRLIGEGCGEQSARIVVLGSAEDPPRFTALDHLAAPHHDDFARQRPHD